MQETKRDFVKEELIFTTLDRNFYAAIGFIFGLFTFVFVIPTLPFMIFEKITNTIDKKFKHCVLKRKQLKIELRELDEKSKR